MKTAEEVFEEAESATKIEGYHSMFEACILAINYAQIEAWNEAIELAAESIITGTNKFDNKNYIVSKQSIMKLKK